MTTRKTVANPHHEVRTLSLDDLAHVLKIAPRTALNRIRNGDDMPRAIRRGKRFLFLEDDVRAWLMRDAAETRNGAGRRSA